MISVLRFKPDDAGSALDIYGEPTALCEHERVDVE
jgi:hypothetical protein